MAKISVCIISYNEEEKIEECLRSVAKVADEIVVVDSNSTDRTVEIARKYTENVYERAFSGYVEQKNFSVDKATHDWILNLDCDERLSPELEQALLKEKDGLGACPAYRVAIKTFYVYRWLDHCWYPDYKVRFFDKQRCKWGGVKLHEKVVVPEGEATGTLTGDLLHYSYDSISDHLRTIDKYTDMAAAEIIESGRRIGPLTPLTHSAWAFFRLYVLQRGFLDGFAGLSVAVLSATHSFVKYMKVLVRPDSRS